MKFFLKTFLKIQNRIFVWAMIDLNLLFLCYTPL